MCEGPEDAISIAQAIPGAAVFATCGKQNYLNARILTEYKHVVMALDNDGKNIKEMPEILNKARELNTRIKEVWLAQPELKKQDYNTMLRDENLGANKIIETIDSAKNIKDFDGKSITTKGTFGDRFNQISTAQISGKLVNITNDFGKENSIKTKQVLQKERES